MIFQYKFLTITAICSILIGCGSYKQFVPPEQLPGDRRNIPQPKERSSFNDFSDAFDKQFVLQGEQFLDLSRHLRHVSDNPKEAYNINAFDEVPNSSWFTNRNGEKRMSLEETIKGPDTCEGPDTSKTWTIIRAKAEGVTPGFTIIDSRGDKYVIKFDPIGYAGLNSGSEVIGSKIFYAAGYNVPENYICYFNPRILELGDKVKILDEKGRKRHMNREDLKMMLDRVEFLPNGLIRATASKYVEGKPIGPFKYEKVRRDDPNDFIPHQHRRELRGLRVLAAWLNHIDSKAANSMDTYFNENEKSYVKHYLIDFGTILGSGGRGPQPKYRGYENEIDPKAMTLRFFTFGLYSPRWERVPDRVEYPCVGRYYSDFYHPKKFKIIFPNPAYDNMTDRDGYWGAKLVMSFTDEQLRAIVREAQYPDAEAEEFLLETMIERRDITGRYWFNRVCPLDNFIVTDYEDGLQKLQFTDLAVETGLESAEKSVFRYSASLNGKTMIPLTEIGNRCEINLPDPTSFNSDGNYPVNQWELTLQVKRGNKGKWSKPVEVYMNQTSDDKLKLVGLYRD